MQPLKALFPALSGPDNSLVYLDSAATTQKPQVVLDAMQAFYQHQNANVHRGAHALSVKATKAYEGARARIAEFVGVSSAAQIIFCHGTTHAVNQVAHGLAHTFQSGDRILVDGAAHHANIVPWQELAKSRGAIIEPIVLDELGRIDLNAYQQALSNKPKLVALNHVSNVLGHHNPLAKLIPMAKRAGAMTLVDGAQAVAHLPVDVEALGCDFYVFSGHKMYGPTGVGILTGTLAALEMLQPLMTGGEMIKQVSWQGSSFTKLPNRLEAGTPPIAEVIGLGAAVEFLQGLDREAIAKQESQLLTTARQGLQRLGFTSYGDPNNCHGALAFNLAGEHHQDIGILLDQQQVAVRCGHHCAMPLMSHLGLAGSCRLSVALYNDQSDIELALDALAQAKELLHG
ncbi:aminotransferase class V-fold PLP-dependent enzyme [Paraferrimonas sedimenticola]|uniref:Cysteine desulfurase n=1 Tax=Paraferrimonas sedimenticola TaxID=375674 RepID=A0AA37W214_9GAMM|nr:cysteine desulfurase [Paraferrimonas sedimenticola]GLP97273.1 cysteine desulfurase [Paraferrimonas sedimenticola]